MTYSVAPGINNMFMSIGFRLFPSSDAAKGKKLKNLTGCKKHMHAFSQVSIGNLKYSANLNKKRLMKALFIDSITHLKIRHALF